MVQGIICLFFVRWSCSSISSSDLSATIFHSRVLQPKIWSRAATAWDSGIQGDIEFGYLSEGWTNHRRVQFSNPLQWCCLPLPVYWLTLSFVPRGSCHTIPERPCLWIRQGKNNIRYYHNRIFALRPAPQKSEPVRLRPTWWPNWTDLITGIVVELQGPSTE